jgi:methyl-accepting chemotaxis protein
MNYRIEDVRGRHHAMFVEPGYAQTADYAAFWDRLRSGAFFTGLFQRYGRDHRAIWIQASYNPIFDPSGRLTKVVKFAIDVTANMQARSVAVDAAENTLDHVETVTTSAESMNAAAVEISHSMAQSKTAVDDIHSRTEEADAATERLQAAAAALSGIGGVIAGIAKQINLLALNATIEAVRAGEAGRGFAVVANEVKELAGQAAAATARISGEVGGMQAVSAEVATTLASITEAIGTISAHVDGVSAAMDDQARATGDILASMRHAASGMSLISTSLDNWTVGMEERRSERRSRVLLPARILVPNTDGLDCTIRDLTEGGARVHVPHHKQVPNRFSLVVEASGRRYECEAKHRSGAMINVQFVVPKGLGLGRAA